MTTFSFDREELVSLVAIYQRLHAAPELSYFERETSTFLAEELRGLGCEVTEEVGRYDDPALTSYGVVALFRNGPGPLVMIRADMDALPVEEQSGAPYASRVRSVNSNGENVGVMHACGHDLHVTCLIGAARALIAQRATWSGTLMLIGQPSEEMGAGAKAMLRDDLYQRFGRPDFVLALHDNAQLEAGRIGYVEGFALANVDSLEVTIRGVGGHGAYPHTTHDPVVLAAQFVVAVQAIISRERPPLDPAVITVGSIHGGTKSNVIPDEVVLQLTVRSYRSEVRTQLLSAIRRVAFGLAIATGVPDACLPIVRPLPTDAALDATWNDPPLMRRLVALWRRELGDDQVVEMQPVMGGEDVGQFSLGGEIPFVIFWVGAVDPEAAEAARQSGRALPSLHSATFIPLAEPAIRTGVRAMTLAALELLGRRK